MSAAKPGTICASDLMTRNPIVVSPEDSVERALELMIDNDIRHLPVVENGELVAVLSDRDLREVVPKPSDELNDPKASKLKRLMPVRNIYHTDFVSVDPDTDLLEVIDLILEERIGAVPVVDANDGRLVGIVSYVDILRRVRELLQ